MKLRISLLDLLVFVALVAGLTAYFWSGWSRRQLEPRIRVMRQQVGEVTISNTRDIHAIHKPRYTMSANLIKWDVFLPSGEFRICFANVTISNTKSKLEPNGPIRSFPIENGKHEIVVKWTTPKPDPNVKTETNKFQQVDVSVDGKSVGKVEDELPMSAIQVLGTPVPAQVDVSPSPDPKLQLACFWTSADFMMSIPNNSRCWMVWIESVREDVK